MAWVKSTFIPDYWFNPDTGESIFSTTDPNLTETTTTTDTTDSDYVGGLIDQDPIFTDPDGLGSGTITDPEIVTPEGEQTRAQEVAHASFDEYWASLADLGLDLPTAPFRSTEILESNWGELWDMWAPDYRTRIYYTTNDFIDASKKVWQAWKAGDITDEQMKNWDFSVSGIDPKALWGAVFSNSQGGDDNLAMKDFGVDTEFNYWMGAKAALANGPETAQWYKNLTGYYDVIQGRLSNINEAGSFSGGTTEDGYLKFEYHNDFGDILTTVIDVAQIATDIYANIVTGGVWGAAKAGAMWASGEGSFGDFATAATLAYLGQDFQAAKAAEVGKTGAALESAKVATQQAKQLYQYAKLANAIANKDYLSALTTSFDMKLLGDGSSLTEALMDQVSTGVYYEGNTLFDDVVDFLGNQGITNIDAARDIATSLGSSVISGAFADDWNGALANVIATVGARYGADLFDPTIVAPELQARLNAELTAKSDAFMMQHSFIPLGIYNAGEQRYANFYYETLRGDYKAATDALYKDTGIKFDAKYYAERYGVPEEFAYEDFVLTGQKEGFTVSKLHDDLLFSLEWSRLLNAGLAYGEGTLQELHPTSVEAVYNNLKELWATDRNAVYAMQGNEVAPDLFKLQEYFQFDQGANEDFGFKEIQMNGHTYDEIASGAVSAHWNPVTNQFEYMSRTEWIFADLGVVDNFPTDTYVTVDPNGNLKSSSGVYINPVTGKINFLADSYYIENIQALAETLGTDFTQYGFDADSAALIKAAIEGNVDFSNVSVQGGNVSGITRNMTVQNADGTTQELAFLRAGVGIDADDPWEVVMNFFGGNAASYDEVYKKFEGEGFTILGYIGEGILSSDWFQDVIVMSSTPALMGMKWLADNYADTTTGEIAAKFLTALGSAPLKHLTASAIQMGMDQNSQASKHIVDQLVSLQTDVMSAETLANELLNNKTLANATGWVDKISALGENLWERPYETLVLPLAEELGEESIPIILGTITGAVGGVPAALVTSAAYDLTEAYNFTYLEKYTEATAFGAKYEEQILADGWSSVDAWAKNIAENSGTLATIFTAATLGLELPLEQKIFSTIFPDSKAYQFATDLLGTAKEGATIFVKEGVSEALEEGGVQLYVEAMFYGYDPNRDVSGNVALSAAYGALLGAHTAGTMYGGSLVSDFLQGNESVATAYNSMSDTQRNTFFDTLMDGGFTPQGIADIFNTYDPSRFNSTQEVYDAYALLGYTPTQQDVTNFIGFSADNPDLNTSITNYVDSGDYIGEVGSKGATIYETFYNPDTGTYEVVTDDNGNKLLLTGRTEYDPRDLNKDGIVQSYENAGFASQEEYDAFVSSLDPRDLNQDGVVSYAEAGFSSQAAYDAFLAGLDPRDLNQDGVVSYDEAGFESQAAYDAFLAGVEPPAEEPEVETPTYDPADINRDGTVSDLEQRAYVALQYAMGATDPSTLSPEEFASYDVDGDGKITSADAFAALKGEVGTYTPPADDPANDPTNEDPADTPIGDPAMTEAEFSQLLSDALGGLNDIDKQTVIDAVSSVVGDLNNLSAQDVQDIIDGLNNISTSDVQDIVDGLNDLSIGDIESLLGDLNNLSKSDVQDIIDTLNNLSTEDVQKVIDGLNDLSAGDVQTIIDGLNNLSATDVQNLLDGLNNLSSADVQTLLDGLNDLSASDVQTIIDGLNDLSKDDVQTIVNGLNNLSESQVQDIIDAQTTTIDETIGDLADALGTTEGTILDAIDTSEGNIEGFIDTLTESLGTTEKNILDALGTQTDTIADMLGTTEDNIQGYLDTQTETLTGAIGTSEEVVTDAISALADALNTTEGVITDAITLSEGNIEGFIDTLSTQLGVSTELIVNNLATTADTITGAVTDLGTELSTELQEISTFLGKPAQELTQADIDMVTTLIAGDTVTSDQTLMYDVTNDGVLDQADLDLMLQIQQNPELAQDLTSSQFANSGVYDIVANLGLDINQNIDTSTDITAGNIAAAEQRLNQQSAARDVMGMIMGASDLTGQKVSVNTPDPARINYVYGFEDIFATPQQAGMFVSPYGASGAQQTKQAQQSIFGAPLFAEGGHVESSDEPMSDDEFLRLVGGA